MSINEELINTTIKTNMTAPLLNKAQIHKLIIKVQKSLQETKNKPMRDREEDLLNLLGAYGKEITMIEDDDNNSLAQIAIKNAQLENLKVIINTYKKLLDNDKSFYKWLIHQNCEEMTIFELISQKGNIAIIKYISETLKNEFTKYFNVESDRNNLFHIAAMKNQCYPIIFFYEKFQRLYPRTLILDIQNFEGKSPLHFACYYGNKKAMDLLIDLGSNINCIDFEGNTPLHLAVENGNCRSIKKLLVRGADKFIKNRKGELPYDLALSNNNEEAIKLLRRKSWYERTFISKEIGPVRGSRNNLMLILFTMIMIFVKILLVIRFAGLLYEDPWLHDIIPLIPDIKERTEEEEETTNLYEVTPKTKRSVEEYINCFLGDRCISVIPFYSLSLLGDIFLLIMTTYFLCFAKMVYSKKKSKKEVRYLSPLFETNRDVCVKCRQTISTDTVHCLVCNACVDNWDHHCFWLNTCISEKNKKGFSIFFYSTFVFMALNMVLFIILFVYTFYFKDLFFHEMFGISNENSKHALVIIQKVVIGGFALFMFLFSAYSEFFIMV